MLNHTEAQILQAVCHAQPPAEANAATWEAASAALDRLLAGLGFEIVEAGCVVRGPSGSLWSVEQAPELIEPPEQGNANRLQQIAALFSEAGQLVDAGLVLLEQAAARGLQEVRDDGAEARCRLADAAAGARDLAGEAQPC